MPVIQRRVTVLANSTNDNIIAGSQYEFARRRCLISGGINSDTLGAQCTINSGGDVVMESFPVKVLNQFPVIPDDFVFQDVMEIGDRLSIGVRNTTAGALDVLVIVQIQEL